MSAPREPWPQFPGLWPYVGVRWLDRLSRWCGDVAEALEHTMNERRIRLELAAQRDRERAGG